MFTLKTAAEHANTSRATVWRWIKSGRLSATRTDAGEFRIDPAELERHLASISANSVPNKAERRTATAPNVSADSEQTSQTAALEAEIAGLRALLEAERRRAEEHKEYAAGWQRQAEAAQRLLADQRPRSGLFGRLFRRAR
jgi:excisionase family DNA binding protein